MFLVMACQRSTTPTSMDNPVAPHTIQTGYIMLGKTGVGTTLKSAAPHNGTSRWLLSASPQGSQVVVPDNDGDTFTFVPDQTGTYLFIRFSETPDKQNTRTLYSIEIVDTKVTDSLIKHDGATSRCVSCHTIGEMSRNKNHIGADNECGTCHSINGWKPTIAFSHDDTLGFLCNECHDGKTARGKTSGHPITQQQCNTCHLTSSWTPQVDKVSRGSENAAATIAHKHKITDTHCVTCHDGMNASGKSAMHLATSDSCGTCHTQGGWRAVYRVNHASLFGSCTTCHASPSRHRAVHVVDAQETIEETIGHPYFDLTPPIT